MFDRGERQMDLELATRVTLVEVSMDAMIGAEGGLLQLSRPGSGRCRCLALTFSRCLTRQRTPPVLHDFVATPPGLLTVGTVYCYLTVICMSAFRSGTWTATHPPHHPGPQRSMASMYMYRSI